MELLERLLQHLSWDELEQVTALIGQERLRRMPPDQRYSLNEEEIGFVRAGRPVVAIKLLRLRTGISLKEAKDIVDVIRSRISVESPAADEDCHDH